jgi:4-carboxymuconolactone decarboxylase
MSRIPEPSREELDAEARAVFDRIAATRGAIRGPYGVLLHHPVLADRVGALGELLRFHSTLPGAERELAILTAGREAGAPYEWAAHEPIARREGTRPQAIACVRDGQPTDGLTPREATIVDTVRALYRARRLTDRQFQRAEAELGRVGLVELVTMAGYYGMIGLVLNAFEVPLPAGTGPGGPFPAGARPPGAEAPG